MATQVFRVDDMNGELIEEGVPPVRFTVEGAAYEIDLTAANREEFLTGLTPYIEKARPKGGKSRPTTSGQTGIAGAAGTATTDGPKLDTVAIRTWAADNWPEPVAEKGRVPAAVVAAYEAAMLAQQISPLEPVPVDPAQGGEPPVAPVDPGSIPSPEGIFAVPDVPTSG